MELHVITNGSMLQEHWERIPSIIHEVDYLHIREHTKTAKELFTLVSLLMENGVPPNKLIMNDRLDLAFVMGLHGVQLGFRSIPLSNIKNKATFHNLQFGKSVHSIDEAVAAMGEEADYLLYGHIFSTQSKKGLPPRGVQSLKEIVHSVTIPVIAIGGITPTNVNEVLLAGAKGIAIMSPIWNTSNPLKVIKDYRSAVQQ